MPQLGFGGGWRGLVAGRGEVTPGLVPQRPRLITDLTDFTQTQQTQHLLGPPTQQTQHTPRGVLGLLVWQHC